MIGRVNTGGGSTKSTIIVSIVTGSTVKAYSDSAYTTLYKTFTEKTTGEYWLTGLDNGTYYLKATKGSDVATLAFTISQYGVYRITMTYNTIPQFTYTGTYEVVDDEDNPISVSLGDWKIRFLTSGTLNFSKLNGAQDGIDVFLVGGGGGGGNAKYDGNNTTATLGGGGGGGGYTNTASNVSVSENTDYSITIGAGGETVSDGGASSAFNETANGGLAGVTGGKGGAGGSGGGGASGYASSGGDGGSDGSDGTDSGYSGGVGQGTTTREFGELNGTLYGGGGGGGSSNHGYSPYNGGIGGDGGGGTGGGASSHAGSAGTANTGGGGGGGAPDGYGPYAGGSGIVIIRNARA